MATLKLDEPLSVDRDGMAHHDQHGREGFWIFFDGVTIEFDDEKHAATLFALIGLRQGYFCGPIPENIKERLLYEGVDEANLR